MMKHVFAEQVFCEMLPPRSRGLHDKKVCIIRFVIPSVNEGTLDLHMSRLDVLQEIVFLIENPEKLHWVLHEKVNLGLGFKIQILF